MSSKIFWWSSRLSHLSKPKVYQAMANMKDISNSHQSLRALITDSLANLDTTTCFLRLSLPNLSASIRSWRERRIRLLLSPQKGNGYDSWGVYVDFLFFTAKLPYGQLIMWWKCLQQKCLPQTCLWWICLWRKYLELTKSYPGVQKCVDYFILEQVGLVLTEVDQQSN